MCTHSHFTKMGKHSSLQGQSGALGRHTATSLEAPNRQSKDSDFESPPTERATVFQQSWEEDPPRKEKNKHYPPNKNKETK